MYCTDHVAINLTELDCTVVYHRVGSAGNCEDSTHFTRSKAAQNRDHCHCPPIELAQDPVVQALYSVKYSALFTTKVFFCQLDHNLLKNAENSANAKNSANAGNTACNKPSRRLI